MEEEILPEMTMIRSDVARERWAGSSTRAGCLGTPTSLVVVDDCSLLQCAHNDGNESNQKASWIDDSSSRTAPTGN